MSNSKMKTERFFIFLITILSLSCTNGSSSKVSTTELNNNQVIEEYNLYFNCPVVLETAPDSNPNFTHHLRGMDDDRENDKGAFYEVYIIDLSYDHSQEKIEQRFHHEIMPILMKDSERSRENIAGKERDAYVSSYHSGDSNGKAIGFVQDGVIYMFNVVGNDRIDKRFDDFISTVSFNSNSEEAKDLIREIIQEDIMETSNMKLYKSPKDKFSIKYPQGWTVKENYNQLLVLMLENNKTSLNFNVVIIRNVKRSLEDLVKGNLRDMKIGFPDVVVLDEYNLYVNDMESIKVETEATNIDETHLQYNAIYSFLNHNNMYIVNFGCDADEKEKYQSTIKKIISTFKISN